MCWTTLAVVSGSLAMWGAVGLTCAGLGVVGVTVWHLVGRPGSRSEREKTDTAGESVGAFVADAEELTERLAAELDARAERVEALLAEVDAKVERLERLAAALPGTPGGSEPVRRAERHEPDPMARQVYRLSDEGHTSVEIAQRLSQGTGQVELILALRRG